MKSLLLILTIFSITQNSVGQVCRSFYPSSQSSTQDPASRSTISNKSKSVISKTNRSFRYSESRVEKLPSGRQLQVYFDQHPSLKLGDEIIVAIPGLGRSYNDLNFFIDEAIHNQKSVVTIELHGQGQTKKLSPKLNQSAKIPAEYNKEDLVYLLERLSTLYKIRLIAHSYGGGIALAALTDTENSKTKVAITKVVLLSPFVKNLDTYYGDSLVSGQWLQVATDMANPYMSQFGVPSQWIQYYDKIFNNQLFKLNLMTQQYRDLFLKLYPFIGDFRKFLTMGPNNFANYALSPAHIIANARLSEIKEWQSNPQSFFELLRINNALINGNNLNFLDFSSPLLLPTKIKYVVVMALNDSVVPNTINQEFVTRMSADGYQISTSSLANENHYYFYSPAVKDNFKVVIGD